MMAPLSFLWIYGNLYAYMDSYFRLSCHGACADSDPQWILSIYLGSGCPGALSTKFLTDRLGQKWTGVMAAVIINASLLGSAWTVQVSVAWTVVVMGVTLGWGVGINLSIAYQNVSGWSPNRASIFMATITSFPSALSMIQNQLITSFVNPHNSVADVIVGPKTYFSQPQILERVPKVIIMYACVNLALQVIGYFLMTSSPQTSQSSSSPSNHDTNENECGKSCNDHTDLEWTVESTHNRGRKTVGHEVKHYGSRRDNADLPDMSEAAKSPEQSMCSSGKFDPEISSVISKSEDEIQFLSLKPLEVLKTPVFYVLLLFGTAQTFALMVKGNYYKQFGLLYIADDQFLTLVGTILPIATSVARLGYGLLISKHIISIKDCAAISLAINTLLCAFWFFIPRINKILYMLFVMCLALAQSSYYVILPSGCLRCFGPKYFSTNFGLLSASVLIVGILGPLFISSLLHVLGWAGLFTATAILGSAALVCALFTEFKTVL